MKTPAKIMAAAEGENCTLAIPNICCYDPKTTVTCHLPDGTGGSNRLTGPLSIAFGCHCCHDAIDGRRRDITHEDKEFFMRRGMNRTINRLIERGLVKFG